MNNRGRFWLGVLSGVLFTVLFALGGVAFLATRYFNILSTPATANIVSEKTTGKKEDVDNSSKLDLEKVNKKILKLEKLIDKNFLFQEDIKKVEDGVYKGLMNGLDDPYSVYYNEEDYKAITTDTSGVYSGIGALVSKNPQTGIVTIMKVFKGSPAEEAGLMSGDILYKVDGDEITEFELEVLVSTRIRGKEGTSFDLTILRGENRDEHTFKVTRRSIEVPTVEHKMLENNTGYLVVSQFDVVTYDQFVAAIEDLKKQGMKKLIIDLRSNPGGVLDTCVNMLDYILPKGLIVYTADKNGKGDKYDSDEEHKLDIPMVVLVNQNSASASEIFAGAIKDFKHGTIMGKKTFGKGIVQNMIPLGDGTAIKITTQHYYTPSGFDLHKKGIEPDVEVDLNKDAIVGDLETDNQLQEAIKELNK